MSDFMSFLQKMEHETGGKSKPQEEEPIFEDEPVFDEDEEDEPIFEDEEDEVVEEKEELDEEIIVERAFDYARIFMKTIRENFSDKHQRRIILETVRNAINMSLGSQPEQIVSEQRQEPQKQKPQDWPDADDTPIRMNDFSDQPAPVQNKMVNEEDYTRNLNLGLKMGPNGQPEVDVSKITNEDINDIKVLAGITEAPKE